MSSEVSRRWFLKGMAATVGGTMLAACAPKTVVIEKEVEKTVVVEREVEKVVTATPAACEVVELRCTHAWPADQWTRQVEFDDVFNQEHPCIAITGENYPWGDTVPKLTTLAAAGTLPDLIYVHYSWAQRFIMDRMILNVQPYLDADSEFWGKEDFVPASLPSYMWQGDLWLIPYNEGPTNLIYYNKRIFDEAGMPYPHSDKDWTLEDLWEVARKMTTGEGEDKIWGYDGLPSAWQINADFLKTWDAEFWNEPCETQSRMHEQNAIDCMAWWLDLYKSGVTPTPAERETVPGDPFAYSRVAMIKGASWSNRWIKPNLKDPYDVAHAPVGHNGTRASSTAGSAYAITKDSKHPDEAWVYLRAYNSTEGQIFLFSSIGIDPTRWSAWPAYFESDATPPNAEVVMEVMEQYGEHNLMDSPNANEALRVAQAILDRLWLEELTPEEVCKQITEECQPIMEQNEEWCTLGQLEG
jgi:multiple sugar transport system substrate-binding protein